MTTFSWTAADGRIVDLTTTNGYKILTGVSGLDAPPVELNTEARTEGDGSLLVKRRTGVRSVALPIFVNTGSNPEVRSELLRDVRTEPLRSRRCVNMAKTIDEILAVAEDQAYHRVAVARIFAVPQALRDEHEELSALLPTFVSDTIDDHPDRVATAERLVAIEAEMDATTIEFRFRCIGHRAWADLLREHPPTKDQLKLDRSLDHNPETFPYEAMAASCVGPVMSADDVARLAASPLIDVRAWADLWSACIKANVVDKNPKSLAAAGLIRRRSEGSVPLPSTTESLEASSSAE